MKVRIATGKKATAIKNGLPYPIWALFRKAKATPFWMGNKKDLKIIEPARIRPRKKNILEINPAMAKMMKFR
jgi:hypothetical protein